jgi:predicted nucleic acid-binding protein
MSRIPSVKHFVSRLGTNRVEREIISDMLEDCCIFDLDVFIKQKAIETGQRSIIKLPDAIIAATSNQKELSLVIADRGFQKIPDSDLIWIDIQ